MFGQLLIDPALHDVQRAASEALREALGGAPAPLPTDLAEELPGLFKVPEGWQVWRVNPRAVLARVGVAWWTDPTGRLHLRVGGAPQPDNAARRFFADWDGLPPLARVHPERCYRRVVAGQPRLVVACDCGISGLPDALSWMGPCCGPCFDRYLETGADVLTDPQRLPASQIILPHPAHVLAVSPDGRRIATAIRGEAFRLWDVASGYELLDGASERCAVDELHFNADGSILAAVCSHDQSLAAWRVPGGDRRCDVPILTHVGGVLFAGNRLVVSTGRRLQIWEVPATGPAVCHGTWRTPIRHMASAPLGFPIALSHASGDQLLVLRSLSGEPEAIKTPSIFPSDLAVSADGRFLALRESHEPAVRIYDLRENRPGARIRMIHDDIRAMVFVPHNSRRLLTAGKDGLVRIWDSLSGRERDAMHWHASTIITIAFSADGHLLATSGEAGVVKFWPWRKLLGD